MNLDHHDQCHGYWCPGSWHCCVINSHDITNRSFSVSRNNPECKCIISSNEFRTWRLNICHLMMIINKIYYKPQSLHHFNFEIQHLGIYGEIVILNFIVPVVHADGIMAPFACYGTQAVFRSTHCGPVIIWQHRAGSTLVQVMACCLTAPSHDLNQCWLIIHQWVRFLAFIWNAQNIYILGRCFKITNSRSEPHPPWPIDSLAQDSGNSSTLVMKLPQSCSKPSIWCHRCWCR